MSGRILIIDDDPIQRRLLEEAVKRFGYERPDRRWRPKQALASS